MSSSKSYMPQPGTVAALTIAHLQSIEPGAEISNREICDALGRQIDGLAALLAPAVSACYLKKRMVNQFGVRPHLLWSLGSESAGFTPPEDTKREAARHPRTVIQTSAMLAPSIFAFATQRCAAPFSVALATDGRLTIQRHGTTVLELTDSERKVVIEAAAKGVRP